MGDAAMNEAADLWAKERTYPHLAFSVERLLELKGDQRISVVVPARNEGSTVGQIVSTIRAELMESVPLVDELLVIDSDSTDNTASVARSAGAEVYAARSIAPELGWRPGKGEAMWKSLFVSTGDVITFIDADLMKFSAHFVTGLVGPLLQDDEVQLVKACYDRDLSGHVNGVGQGGRVTELMARPVINLWWPALAGVMQPLSGEWSARRSLLLGMSMPVGYGVESAVLIDAYRFCGLRAIAQVDLGKRTHRHHDLASLGVMSAEILAAAQRRRFDGVDGAGSTISHPVHTPTGFVWSTTTINDDERPAHTSLRRGITVG